MYRIYVISDRETGHPRYVGKTNQSIHERVYQHIGIDRYTLVGNWFRKQLALSNIPVVSVLDVCDSQSEGLKTEKHYIRLFAKKFDLFNRQHNPNYKANKDSRMILNTDKELL